MQRHLIDTHALLWFLEGSINLSAPARNAITGDSAENFVSIATFWEIAIKSSLGKLELIKPLEAFSEFVLGMGFEFLPLTINDIITVSSLPFNHRDPFDRILVAQAINNDLTIISNDNQISTYEVKRLW